MAKKKSYQEVVDSFKTKPAKGKVRRKKPSTSQSVSMAKYIKKAKKAKTAPGRKKKGKPNKSKAKRPAKRQKGTRQANEGASGYGRSAKTAKKAGLKKKKVNVGAERAKKAAAVAKAAQRAKDKQKTIRHTSPATDKVTKLKEARKKKQGGPKIDISRQKKYSKRAKANREKGEARKQAHKERTARSKQPGSHDKMKDRRAKVEANKKHNKGVQDSIKRRQAAKAERGNRQSDARRDWQQRNRAKVGQEGSLKRKIGKGIAPLASKIAIARFHLKRAMGNPSGEHGEVAATLKEKLDGAINRGKIREMENARSKANVLGMIDNHRRETMKMIDGHGSDVDKPRTRNLQNQVHDKATEKAHDKFDKKDKLNKVRTAGEVGATVAGHLIKSGASGLVKTGRLLGHVGAGVAKGIQAGHKQHRANEKTGDKNSKSAWKVGAKTARKRILGFHALKALSTSRERM